MSKLDNFKGKRGIAGFHNRPENINKNGRPLSIKETYKRTLEERDGIIWQEINWTGTKEDFEKFRAMSNIQMKRRADKYSIGFQLKKKEAIIAQINKLIFNSTDNIKAKMLTWLVEMFDGKAPQSIEDNGGGASVSKYIIAPASVYMQMIREDEAYDEEQRKQTNEKT